MQTGSIDSTLPVDLVLSARGEIVSGYGLFGGVFNGSPVVAREQRRFTRDTAAKYVRLSYRHLRTLQRRQCAYLYKGKYYCDASEYEAYEEAKINKIFLITS